MPKPVPNAPWLHFGEARMTLKRVLNMRRLYGEAATGATVLRGKPVKLVIEATNVCNLACPGCFTGLGENGRVRSAINLDFFHRMLDELGDTLIEIEFYNWGEPFLSKSIVPMIEAAHRRGIATMISTNLSVPFDEARAEAVVRSGLDTLGVSLDGATQENYEKYRRNGDLSLVLRNAQMIIDAKRRLGSAKPKMIWSFHIFEHNVDDIGLASAKADEMGFDEKAFSKGFTYDREWADDRFKYFPTHYTPLRCPFPWFYAVIHNDGGVAPCCGSFYREDDLGRISIASGQPGVASFAEVWNNEGFQHARGLFENSTGETPPKCGKICDECLQTKVYQGHLAHVEAGEPSETFHTDYTPNDGHNFFYHWRPDRDTKKVLRPARPAKVAAEAPAER